jgi:hypothetical protein
MVRVEIPHRSPYSALLTVSNLLDIVISLSRTDAREQEVFYCRLVHISSPVPTGHIVLSR